MRKITLSLLLSAVLSSAALAQTVTITASALQDGNAPANGTFYFAPVLNSGSPASYHKPGGGVATVTPSAVLPEVIAV